MMGVNNENSPRSDPFLPVFGQTPAHRAERFFIILRFVGVQWIGQTILGAMRRPVAQ